MLQVADCAVTAKARPNAVAIESAITDGPAGEGDGLQFLCVNLSELCLDESSVGPLVWRAGLRKI